MRFKTSLLVPSSRLLDTADYSGAFRMPEVRDTDVCIDVWSECVRLDFPGLEQSKRVSDFCVLHGCPRRFRSGIERACNVLECNCRFTPTGRAVMDYFSERLDKTLLPLAEKWKTDALPVLHLERHTEFELRAQPTIAASVAAHQQRWESRYGLAVAL
jgi:hypothetical protein